MGLLSGLGKVDWGSVANGLGAAQSFFDGDFATGSGLLAYGAKQRSAAQKARDEEEERRRLREAARKAFPNASEAELDLYMSGDMRTSDLRPAPSSMERDLSTWQGWNPEQQQTYIEMQDARNPQQQFIPDGRGGGRVVNLPRTGTMPTAPVGRLTPLPEQSAGEFTQEQYRGLVSSLGQQQADEYLRRHGMRVRGY